MRHTTEPMTPFAAEMLNSTISKYPVYVFVTLSGKRRIGRVARFNCHTMWVKIMIGAKSSIIVKRKFKRDYIRLYKIGGRYEAVHTPVGNEGTVTGRLSVPATV